MTSYLEFLYYISSSFIIGKEKSHSNNEDISRKTNRFRMANGLTQKMNSTSFRVVAML